MAKKRSVAFIISSLNSGGAERVISTLSNQLVEIYDIRIITFVGGEPFYKLDERIELYYCTTNIAPSKNIFQAIRTNYRLYKSISAILRREKIELAIGFLPSPNVLAILAAKTNRIPVIISERNNPYLFKLPYFWEVLRKFTYPMADRLVVQTETILEFYKSRIQKEKLIILPNPLSTELTMKTNSVTKENTVLNVGRLTQQKGQDVLIKAFGELNPEGWKLLIIGEGQNRGIYEKLIAELNMTDKIILMGRKKNILDYYASAKIFAFPSRFEGFPNALIEAMHIGLPSIATDCPTGPSELIENGVNGFLIPVDDQKELEKGLNLLINDAGLRNRFSERGRMATTPFLTENVVKKWANLISKTLKS